MNVKCYLFSTAVENTNENGELNYSTKNVYAMASDIKQAIAKVEAAGVAIELTTSIDVVPVAGILSSSEGKEVQVNQLVKADGCIMLYPVYEVKDIKAACNLQDAVATAVYDESAILV